MCKSAESKRLTSDTSLQIDDIDIRIVKELNGITPDELVAQLLISVIHSWTFDLCYLYTRAGR